MSKIQRRAHGAELVFEEELPLATQGRYIVNRYNERVKWACINWFGAYSPGQMVVGGLEKQRLEDIVARILEMGFNCVRLPYSTQGYWENPLINDSFVEANPRFMNQGLRFLDVLGATIEALTRQNIMVILNNHISKSTWCCLWPMEDGVWHTSEWPEDKWIGSVRGMAERFKDNWMVVGHDLRNEPHDYAAGGIFLTWGDGNNDTDLLAAQERAGNAVLEVAPHALIVVEAPCFDSDFRDAREHWVKLDRPRRVVYQAHNYVFFMDNSFFSVRFMSWEQVEEFSLKYLVGVLVMNILLLCAWRLIGAPKPPVGLVSFVVGLTMIIFGLFFLIVWQKTLPSAAKLKACAYGMPKDYAFITYIYLNLLVGGSLMLLFSAFRVTFLRHLPCDCFHNDETQSDVICHWCTFCGVKGFGSLWIITSQIRGLLKTVGKGCYTKTAKLYQSRRNVTRAMSVAPDGEQPATNGGAPPLSPRDSSDYDEADSEEAALTSDPDGDESLKGAASDPNMKEYPHAQWDHCVCISFSFFVVFLLISLGCFGVYTFSKYTRSYTQLERILVQKWGFLLEEGHNYTAPVWLGEFGESTRGNYWLNLMKFLSDWDIDWAYWPLNGLKYIDQTRVETGTDLWGIFMGTLDVTIKYITPHWEEETWGLLYPDYMTVRRPWLLMDLQAIMPSPVAWVPKQSPCERELVGPACGG
jgi:hypothetical protein